MKHECKNCKYDFEPKMKRYKNNGDGTILDTTIGPMWLRDSRDYSVKPQKWQEAVDGCKQFSFAGHKDWRLPTAQELFGIVNGHKDWRLPTAQELFGIVNFDKKKFPLIDDVFVCPDRWYWTKKEYVPNAGYAMVVDFGFGNVANGSKTDAFYVRPVRGGWNENKAL